ncbi:MAG TPA: nucleoside phosphorylase [Gammaproteobacteria bacterium]|nr:nucleoside phosphorylase [Gammaproteobacteria bacterium]
MSSLFMPHHLHATAADFAGNDSIGRYVFMPGSDGRAKEIASHFSDLETRPHPRGHNVYLGNLKTDEGQTIAVAAVSSGMGCPSTEIIVHELYYLGVKRFLRIGTAGTLQPGLVRVGDIVNVQASVRDEDTTRHYAPVEVPAVASLEYVSSVLLASEHLKLSRYIHTGTVHCKSSLYARELAAGPRSSENNAYLNLLAESGVLASEMETATLFIQSQLYNYQLMQQGEGHAFHVRAGAILAIIGDTFEQSKEADEAVKNSIQLALETVKTLAAQELPG